MNSIIHCLKEMKEKSLQKQFLLDNKTGIVIVDT